ncbi:DUF862-domain-containing protein [Lactarius sanguifluus]|nr:DUF862-domain-containing protein [Lactarius sanguifluus]
MSHPVKLYVYDLSNGLARTMSPQFLGRQIDGIWHTSVVVFNRELFYGMGIQIAAPGQSHHGQPLQILDMGETALDEEVFEEYLAEMRDHYTADKVCLPHLPSDFLSTPFGAALRPTIDSMFRRPTGLTPPAVPGQQQPSPRPASSSLLQAVTDRATAGAAVDSGYSTPSTSTVAGAIHVSTNPASFRSLLESHRAVVAMFTSATCGPCRMIEPVFEDLAHAKSRGRGGEGKVAFAKVDLGVGMGGAVARQYDVSATPTFGFFLDGKRIHELKGVNAPELRTQVDLLLYQAFPPHPHTSLDIPSISSLSTEPILFTQVPALDTVHDKLVSFIDSTPSVQNPTVLKDDLTLTMFPWLKQRYAEKSQATATSPEVVAAFSRTNCRPASLFPLLDVWRLAILEPTIAQVTLAPLVQVLSSTNESVASSPRATLLTLLRLTTNCLGTSLSRSLLASDDRARAALTGVLVQTLLHPDRLVRVAAASLGFNVGAWVQKGRIARARGDDVVSGLREGEEDGEWEVELVSAVAEALANEEESEDAVHRLTATLAFLIRLSPFYQDQLVTLLGVLQVQETLKGKLAEDGQLRLKKKEIRALVAEVAQQLCTST